MAPENNRGMFVIPQIMTNHAGQFIDTCHMLMELGYHEINLNLGCPAATVVTKARGSGFLADTGKLDRFFEEVFMVLEAEHSTLAVSVKTRIGMEFSEEFEDILKIYNRYPLSEIIIHPRLQKDYYGNHPNLEVFSDAFNQSVHPVCYNGDIFTKADYDVFIKRFPSVDRIMLGRGVVGNPGLVREIVTGQQISKQELRDYHDRLYAGYKDALGNEKDVLFKMKEVWYYLGTNFLNAEKVLKKIRKAGRPEDYSVAVESVFEDCEFSG